MNVVKIPAEEVVIYIIDYKREMGLDSLGSVTRAKVKANLKEAIEKDGMKAIGNIKTSRVYVERVAIVTYWVQAAPKKYFEQEVKETDDSILGGLWKPGHKAKCEHDFSLGRLWKPGDKLHFHTEIDLMHKEALVAEKYITVDCIVLKEVRWCNRCGTFEEEVLNEILSV
jgi:hypothetical protein